jgi:hypothetical protein
MVRPPELIEQLLAMRRESTRFVIDHPEVGKDAHDIAESVAAETRPDNHACRSEDTPIGEETQRAFQAVPHLAQRRIEVGFHRSPINDGDQQVPNAQVRRVAQDGKYPLGP